MLKVGWFVIQRTKRVEWDGKLCCLLVLVVVESRPLKKMRLLSFRLLFPSNLLHHFVFLSFFLSFLLAVAPASLYFMGRGKVKKQSANNA